MYHTCIVGRGYLGTWRQYEAMVYMFWAYDFWKYFRLSDDGKTEVGINNSGDGWKLFRDIPVKNVTLIIGTSWWRMTPYLFRHYQEGWKKCLSHGCLSACQLFRFTQSMTGALTAVNENIKSHEFIQYLYKPPQTMNLI